MALATVADYIDSARLILQDQVEPYRYEPASLILALNAGLLETFRLRPDFFLGIDPPQYSATDQTVNYPMAYRMALVYYMAGHAQVRDDEDVTDSRAAGFMNKFVAQLTSLVA